ncbi:PASTA domain-containing protein [Amycolatopsis acidicola]|uniref:PASTA domain-containing protein n=1 Tax=Amycolatopsis acidicola TaxID=2596893 RepID=A0A5N0UYC7_9PSEU|nr:PASTA domain-containing protein [Amycolatopsis acidicola]KAA9157449.1 PASTA domain-containing protein [Amycolatopsis acidicola]
MDPWDEAQQAWRRLAGWSGSAPGEALSALDDLGLVRRLLDQTEFEAVRTARAEGRSWSEIAVRLGVTRQSAWERWRDIDEPAPAPEPVSGRSARHRRRSSVKVPNVIGRSIEDARALLEKEDLHAVSPDPGDVPLDVLDRPGGVVTDQSPESGARVPPGSLVRLWVDRGEGGVREPRRPEPEPRTGRKMKDEITDQTVN